MKTFYTILASVLIALIIFVGGVVYVLNYVPFGALGLITFNKPLQLGTTLTTLNSSDTMSDFPTLYNANNLALNSGKIEISTTTLPLITTLANLSTVGTITTGVWTGTLISVSKGGTGSTTLASGQVLLGSSTNAIGIVNGFGASGQFLTSNGAGLAPTWQTSAVSLSDNYIWTGQHTFNASSTFNATTTFAARLTSNTATTTVYNDLLIMGSIKQNGVRYGATQICQGQTSITGDDVTYSATAITCGFQPTVIQVTAGITGNPTLISMGSSNNGVNQAMYFDSKSGTGALRQTSTSSIAAIGPDFYVFASTTPTATGFNLGYKLVNYGAYDSLLIDYIAW